MEHCGTGIIAAVDDSASYSAGRACDCPISNSRACDRAIHHQRTRIRALVTEKEPDESVASVSATNIKEK
jgi:hypothetical protein